MRRSNDQLLRRPPQLPSRGKKPLVQELGPDPLVRHFETGPFPAAEVPAVAPAAAALFERLTGQRFDPAVIAAWERVRAFLAYPGVEVSTPMELARRAAPDPIDRGPPISMGRSVRPGLRPGPGLSEPGPGLSGSPAAVSGSPRTPGRFDPRDLGD